MDRVLHEAYFAFYWLSEQRQSSTGMGGAHLFLIPLSEITIYYQTFRPRMDMQHFVRVIRAADRMYCSLAAKRMKQQSESKRLKRSGK